MSHILNKSYTPYIILLLITPIYLINVMPGHSWVSAGVDHFDFIFAADYHLVPHSTGFPIYMIPANIILEIFNDVNRAWILALTLSTIPALINLLLVFYITKELAKDYIQEESRRIAAPYIAMLTLGGAGVILAQAFIVEVYLFSMTFMLSTILLHTKHKYNWASLLMGLSIGTHGLVWTIMFLLFLWNWKIYFRKIYIIAPFAILPYGYLPWAMSDIDRGNLTTLLGTNLKDYINYIRFGTSSFWWGTLPIWNVPERIYDTIILLSTSMGLTILGLFLLIKEDYKKYLWLLIPIVPTLYYWLGTAVKIVHVHLAIAVPILIILAALGTKYSKIPSKYYLIVSTILILIIPFYWDIGRIIDKDMSAQNYYEFLTELPNEDHIIVNIAKIKNDTIFNNSITDGTAIWWAILLYRNDTGRNITTIFPDRAIETSKYMNGQVMHEWYKEVLEEQGINVPNAIIREKDYLQEKRLTNIELEANDFYTELNGKQITLPNYIINKKYLDRKNNDELAVIHEFSLWYFIDRLDQVNPNKKIHYVIKEGTKDIKFKDKIYNRNDIPIKYRRAIEEIYEKAGL